ncbi:hypothetical protein BKN14_01595 [Candidatus Gracilibacteria bacterium HOT-871]|nr:hypothetical protein BKN14_01595 [Candidatus Gracilibacteria bacterium HOT-871]MBB1565251.1 hypothetical protein [Candidatus Gracilibacteria bacterium]RKW25127.1 MAG: hypothetical protein D8B46_00215 [Candidatus Gracilibacteria bacterium]
MKNEKKVLTLRICGPGFEKLAKGETKYKYREVKSFWETRLFDKKGNPKEYDEIHIINGYKTTSPKAIFEFGGLEGTEEYNGKTCFKIKLGKMLEIQNYDLGK